jgi:hypothetical protein
VGGEARVRQALGRQERARLEGPPGGLDLSVDLFPVRFADVSASFDGDRATVVAMVEAEGRAAFGGESAAVSYVGRERFHMRPCAAALCPEADQLARLRGVLELLVRRHRSLAGTEPGRRVLGWQIRVERATAEAGEDLEVKGADGSPARERARLSLRWAEGGWAILP